MEQPRDDLKKNLAVNSVIYMCSMILPKIVSVITIPLYTHYLTTFEQGIYSYTTNILTVLNIFSVLGLNIYYLRYYSGAEDKREFNGTFFWFIILWNLAFLVIGGYIFFIVWRKVNIQFAFFPYMFLALIYNFLLSIEIIPMRTYRMRNEVNKYFIMILIKTLIMTFVGVVCIIGLGWGVIGRYLADVISSGVLAIIFVIYMIRNSEFRIEWHLLKKGLRFSLPILPSNAIQVSEAMIKSVIIERMLDLSKLGVYSIGSSLASMIYVVSQSISMAIEPELYIRANQKNYNEFLIKMKNLLVVTGGICCLFFGLYVREAVMIFLDQSYYDSWRVVQPLLVSYVLALLTSLFNTIIIIDGQGNKLIVPNAVYMCITILGSILVLYKLDIFYLGLTNIIGQLVMLGIMCCLIKNYQLHDFSLKKDIGFILVLYLVLFLANQCNKLSFLSCIGAKLIILLICSMFIIKFYHFNLGNIISFIKKLGKRKS